MNQAISTNGHTTNGHRRVNDALVEFTPPHDVEAERIVLGSLLVESANEPEPSEKVRRVLATLRPEDFYSGQHQRLYQVMRGLGEQDKPFDALVVWREIEKLGIHEQTGGRDYIASLASGVSNPAHADTYAEIVREKAHARAFYYAAAEVLQAALDGRARSREGIAAFALDRMTEAATGATPVGTLTGKTPAEILDNPDAERAWLVDGLIPRACLVALCSPPKEGKSTLLARVIAALSRAGSVIGLDCSESVAVVWVTEESETTLRALLAGAGLRDARLILVTRAECGGMSWCAVVDGAHALARKHDAALVVFDTFAGLAGLVREEENQTGPVLAALRPVRAITTEGRSVLLTHHLAKDPGRGGVNSLRGSSAFAGEVDGFVLLRREGGEDSTVRSLSGAGRGDGWVRGARYELEPDGSLRRLQGRGQVVAAARRDDLLDAVRANPDGLSQSAVHKIVGGRREDVYAALDAFAADGTLLCTPGERGAKVYRAPVPSSRGQVGTGGAGQGGAPVPAGGPFRGPGDRSPSPTPSRVPDSGGEVGTGRNRTAVADAAERSQR